MDYENSTSPIRHQNQIAFRKVLTSSRTKFRWLSLALEPLVTDDRDIIDTFLTVAKAHPKLCFQIIVADDHLLHFKRHRLIGLMQRLSSSFEVRRYHSPDNCPLTTAFAMSDSCGYVRPIATQWHYELVTEPAQLKALETQFLEHWHVAERFNPFRRLNL